MLGSWKPWALPDREWSLGVHTGSLGGFRVGKGHLETGPVATVQALRDRACGGEGTGKILKFDCDFGFGHRGI